MASSQCPPNHRALRWTNMKWTPRGRLPNGASELSAVAVFLLGHLVFVVCIRYLATHVAHGFKMPILLYLLGDALASFVAYDPKEVEGGEVETVVTLVLVFRVFFTAFAFVFANVAVVVMAVAGGLGAVVLTQHVFAEELVHWGRRVMLVGMAAAAVFLGVLIAVADEVGYKGWAFACVMGGVGAFYDVLFATSTEYGYKPVPLYMRCALRANVLVWVVSVALGFEDPTQIASLSLLEGAVLLVGATGHASSVLVAPWIDVHISPSTIAALEQLSVLIAFAVDTTLLGVSTTTGEAIGVAFIALFVVIFFAMMASEREEMDHAAKHERWRGAYRQTPYVLRGATGGLLAAALLGGVYVPMYWSV